MLVKDLILQNDMIRFVLEKTILAGYLRGMEGQTGRVEEELVWGNEETLAVIREMMVARLHVGHCNGKKWIDLGDKIDKT